MARFYYADGRVLERDASIPDESVIYCTREPIVALSMELNNPSSEIRLVERTFYRRRYAMNRGFYGPVPADDWHENGCPCRGCVARYQVPDEPERCLGYMNGCVCDDCYIRNRYG